MYECYKVDFRAAQLNYIYLIVKGASWVGFAEFQILSNLEKQLLFLGNRHSQNKCSAE